MYYYIVVDETGQLVAQTKVTSFDYSDPDLTDEDIVDMRIESACQDGCLDYDYSELHFIKGGCLIDGMLQI